MAKILHIDDSIPLIGCIAFGLIDRGTNLIQVRPISTCPLSCIFCSTNAGPRSSIRQAEYILPLDCLVEEFEELVIFKGRRNIEAHIDTVGDPLTYPQIVDLVSELAQIEGVKTVSMQTHGLTLDEKKIEELSDAGLHRINLSVDALDPDLARKMTNTEKYDVNHVIDMMRYITQNTTIDLLIAPVWVPGVNDEEIPRIIDLAKELGAGKKYPPLGIQKYEIHKHGRKVRGVRAMSWRAFYERLREWERIHNVKLILHPKDFGIHKRAMLPVPYKKYERVKVEIVAEGWLKREKLAVTNRKDRVITVLNAENIPIGAKLKVRIVANKHNIFIAEAV
ncbi:MAG: radical SAM protein [Candidatus Methanospirareceae archaeon]